MCWADKLKVAPKIVLAAALFLHHVWLHISGSLKKSWKAYMYDVQLLKNDSPTEVKIDIDSVYIVPPALAGAVLM